MKRTNPIHGHTQKIQLAIAKDPLYRKNQPRMCIQDPTNIFSFLMTQMYMVRANERFEKSAMADVAVDAMTKWTPRYRPRKPLRRGEDSCVHSLPEP